MSVQDVFTTSDAFTVRHAEDFDTGRIIVKAGDGQVVIDTKTGTVVLEGCTLDEGARAFWEAVSRIAGGRP